LKLALGHVDDHIDMAAVTIKRTVSSIVLNLVIVNDTVHGLARVMVESWLEPGIRPASQSIFIRVLLDKKYALPFRVIDALVFHFVRSLNDTREYPVLWHQSFLTFAQRYAADPEPHQGGIVLVSIQFDRDLHGVHVGAALMQPRDDVHCMPSKAL
jgi:hypothetical protein